MLVSVDAGGVPAYVLGRVAEVGELPVEDCAPSTFVDQHIGRAEVSVHERGVRRWWRRMLLEPGRHIGQLRLCAEFVACQLSRPPIDFRPGRVGGRRPEDVE